MNTYSPYGVDLEELLADERSWEIFANKFIKLPLSTKEIMTSSQTSTYLKYLCQKLGLNQEKSAELSRIVRDTLLGDRIVGEMSNEIYNRLKVDNLSAEKIKNQILKDLLRMGDSSEFLQPRAFTPPRPVTPEKPDLKIEPDINRNNIVDLRNKNNP